MRPTRGERAGGGLRTEETMRYLNSELYGPKVKHLTLKVMNRVFSSDRSCLGSERHSARREVLKRRRGYRLEPILLSPMLADSIGAVPSYSDIEQCP